MWSEKQLKPYLQQYDLTEEQQQIVKELLENNWSTLTVRHVMHINDRKITPLRKKLRAELPVMIWHDHPEMTTSDLEKTLGISRKTIMKLLKPLGYNPKAHYQRMISPKQQYLASLGQQHANDQMLTADNIDEFINKHRKTYSYFDVKQALYQHNSALQQQMYHQMTKLSAKRRHELQTNVYQRKVFLKALKLDFPDYTNMQLSGLLYQNARLVRISRTLTDVERQEIIYNYCIGKETAYGLAQRFEITYKRVMKLLQAAGALNVETDQKQNKLRYQKSVDALDQISKDDLHRVAEHKRIKARSGQQISIDYMGQIPQWAWNVVATEQPIDWFDKLHSFFTNKSKVLMFLDLATQYKHRKIAISELDAIFPPLKGVRNVSTLIYNTFGQDQDIKQHTSIQNSQYETRIADLLTKMKIKFKRNDRQIIKPRELDFYLPEQHIAIEVSPIRTHNSNKFRHEFVAPKPSTYHYTKYKHCKTLGIKLLTLFQKDLEEPTWSNITVPMLKFQLTQHVEHVYYGRDVVIEKVDKKVAKKFLNQWHTDGAVAFNTAYGVFNQQHQLLGIAALAKPQVPKYKQMNLLELKRLAWRSDVQVRYGLSKLVSQIKANYCNQFNGLLSYSNNNLGDGSSYAKAGFKFIKETGPQLMFINPRHPQDHYSWSIATPWGAKSGVLAKTFGSQEMTRNEAQKVVETELPHRADRGKGYDAQYDSGNKVWIYQF